MLSSIQKNSIISIQTHKNSYSSFLLVLEIIGNIVIGFKLHNLSHIYLCELRCELPDPFVEQLVGFKYKSKYVMQAYRLNENGHWKITDCSNMELADIFFDPVLKILKNEMVRKPDEKDVREVMDYMLGHPELDFFSDLRLSSDLSQEIVSEGVRDKITGRKKAINADISALNIVERPRRSNRVKESIDSQQDFDSDFDHAIAIKKKKQFRLVNLDPCYPPLSFSQLDQVKVAATKSDFLHFANKIYHQCSNCKAVHNLSNLSNSPNYFCGNLTLICDCSRMIPLINFEI